MATKKSKKKIIILIVSLVLCFQVVCGVGYYFLSQYVNNIDKEGFVESCRTYLEKNTEFISEYGSIIKFDTKEKFPPTHIEEENRSEYYFTYDCETEKAIFKIRVYRVYITDSDGNSNRSYRYEIINDTLKWKNKY